MTDRKIEMFLKTMQLIADQGDFATLIESAVELSLAAVCEIAPQPEVVDNWLQERKEKAQAIRKSPYIEPEPPK